MLQFMRRPVSRTAFPDPRLRNIALWSFRLRNCGSGAARFRQRSARALLFGTVDPRRVVYTLLIINKAGGLVYNRTFNETLGKLSTNDYLVLAGTFHGVHAITRSLTPSAITSQLAQSLPVGPGAAGGGGGALPHPGGTSGGVGASPSKGGGSSANVAQAQAQAAAARAAGVVVDASGPSPAAAVRAQLSGIEVLESGLFRLTCFQTVSGTKFLLFTEPTQPNVDAIMRRVYELYADYVMKNPFYQLEMPIRAENFDRHLGAYLRAK